MMDNTYIYIAESSEEDMNCVFTDEVKGCIENTMGSEGTRIDVSALGEGFCAPKVKYIFSTWNMPKLSEEEIARMFPSLECVFYAAGSVKYFAAPFLNRGIRVFSAAAANAVPVSEYAASAIVLATKGFFNARITPRRHFFDAKRRAAGHPGNHRAAVGILGAGCVGRGVIERIRRETELDVLVYDPFVTEEQCADMGCSKASLEEVFSLSDVISNHMADVPETRGIIDARVLGLMKPTAGIINTGRGAQIDERALVRALRMERGRFAVLDVTFPEPVRPWNPLLRLGNVYVTPHIAGSTGNEVERLGLAMAEEARRVRGGDEPLCEVRFEQLERMA